MFGDLDVGDQVAPVDVEDGVEATLMETLEEFDVAPVGHPHLRAVEKGGENYGSVGRVGQTQLSKLCRPPLSRRSPHTAESCGLGSPTSPSGSPKPALKVAAASIETGFLIGTGRLC